MAKHSKGKKFLRQKVIWEGRILFALVWLTTLYSFSSASEVTSFPLSVTLTTPPHITARSTVNVDMIIHRDDSLSEFDIGMVTFSLAYDTTLIKFYNITNTTFFDTAGWSFGFILKPLFLDDTHNMLIRFTAKKTSAASAPLLNDQKLTLQFSLSGDSLRHDTSTTIDFVWGDCHANTLYNSRSDTVFTAASVLTADGYDITGYHGFFPSLVGPDSICFTDSLQYGDTVALPLITFRNTKIQFPSATDVTEPAPSQGELPLGITLKQNFPNPFNSSTRISFSPPYRTEWQLRIFNIEGQLVRQYQGIGTGLETTIIWDGKNSDGLDVASGVYYYRLITDETALSKKMLLLK